MADYGASDTSTTTLGANQFPISEAWTPNAGFSAVEGGPQSTDAGGKKSAPVSMYVKDGNDVTLGTSTDANTVNSVMGRLTKIRDLLNATLTVGGTITEANSAAILAALGAVSDAAWSGTGNGSEIAILKKIVAELAATLTVSGTVTVNAGTNLNTSLLALESGGNLAASKADLDTIVTNTNKIPASPAQEAGNLLSIKNDLDTINTNMATLVPGVQGWIAATGTGTASTDDALTFANQVRRVVLYNASANAIPIEFDQTSTATSFPIQPGQYMVFDNVLCTVVHVFPSATLPINTTAGLYVKGWK